MEQANTAVYFWLYSAYTLTTISQLPKAFWSKRFYRLDAVPVAQPTASKHCQQ